MAQHFTSRHIGPRQEDVQQMLDIIGVKDLDQLIEQTIPDAIRMEGDLDLNEAMSEQAYLAHIYGIGEKNQVLTSYIGCGYYPSNTPAVIQRNILENPGWYTAYSPYQAEIAQGRLEGLLNFQTMAIELSGMEIANASLLDESTAAAEAISMLFAARTRSQQKASVNKCFVSEDMYPQTLALLRTRSEPIGIELVVGKLEDFRPDTSFYAAILQYPTATGSVKDMTAFAASCESAGVKLAVAADLVALTLLEAPGVWGAEVVFGSTQRLGIPMGFGGPHAAYFATKEAYKRHIPGRIIGQSIDVEGKPALRMALQTREQHIKRAKATSNICTSQVLLAVMAGMYAVYHGPDGMKQIASNMHDRARMLAESLTAMGYQLRHQAFFDSLCIEADASLKASIAQATLAVGINVGYGDDHVMIACFEGMDDQQTLELTQAMADAIGKEVVDLSTSLQSVLPEAVLRQSEFMTHEVFHAYRSETDMMRYIKRLERKDISLNHSMIALGSCTMKLNAAVQMLPLSWPAFTNMHPFAPKDQALGYLTMIHQLEDDLSEITGFAATSLQPNSGAQGEYAGLMVIKAYHASRGETQRDMVLVPTSAHGTNPASAVMAGMRVALVQCDASGNIDLEDLKSQAEKYGDQLAALMITYPSTHGVFEPAVMEITSTIHQHGGQVYMDGANMNAQVGLTSPGLIGADVCHLNLHKTFAIPHGGGGPGVGPICVAEHLADFLPGHEAMETGGAQGIGSVSAAPFGSALVTLVSYGYIKLLGPKGLLESTRHAILNANYLKARLEGAYQVLYTGEAGRAAHEMILDCRPFKATTKVEVTDIAKRLIDYGYHAPTVSFPVAGTLMIEPTESESKAELDRFCDAMLGIHQEIMALEVDGADLSMNLLKQAPHTLAMVTSDDWDRPYSRMEAAFPLEGSMDNKIWPAVRRVNEAHGDRNLICACVPISDYA